MINESIPAGKRMTLFGMQLSLPQGQIIMEGRGEELLESDMIRNAYLGI